jgi:hypothetical protein
MSAEQAQREPTMEEILASIRRIISEEDKPAEAGGDVLDLQPPPAEVKVPPAAPAPPPAPPASAPKPEPVVAKAPPPAPVFEEPVEIAPPARPLEDELMIMDQEEPAPPPMPAPEPVVAKAPPPAPRAEWTPPPASHETLVSHPVASQTAGALSKLMGSMLVSSSGTLDDVVRELLKPMLKEWLDSNLPALVEAEVAKEIDRIRRLAR